MPVSTPTRPQPPSLTDPTRGDAPLWVIGQEGEEPGIEAEDTQEKQKQPANWVSRMKDSYRFSTTYVDSNYRRQWEDSIRAFNNQHASDSKYLTETFRKRSNLFRPKTRQIVRKNEAAAAAAFFTNMDLLNIEPLNQGIKEEVISAQVMQQIIQYRLTKTIPWFHVVCGGIQDAMVQGVVCAHIHWRFVPGQEDKPCVDIFPVENLRIDPSANWMDPVGTSPYLIEIIPMYWGDVQERMHTPNPKGQRWKEYPSNVVFSTPDGADDSTRQARIGSQEDPHKKNRDISDYDIVWVHRHIHRFEGNDWEFYSLGSQRMLTEPEELEQNVWHGKRPYVIGTTMIETHKAMPASLPTVIKPLQDEANDLWNQRSDNVKFVLNKAWKVKRGKNVDLQALVRNTPGRVILMDDPEADAMPIEWPDVTASAYQEQDRLDSDFNDLSGNFSPMAAQTQRTPRESTRTMQMLSNPANLLTEYALKTFVETFIEPVLRQLVLLEQHYESDNVVLALAGEKAKVFQKFGISEMTDVLLDKELTIKCNVGMGATDPNAKLQRFIGACMSFAQIAKIMPPGLDLKEVAKEMFGLSGYQDGQRFMVDGMDPMQAKLQQQNQQMMKMLQAAGMQIKNKEGANQAKILSTRENNATKLAIEQMKHHAGAKMKVADYLIQIDQGERAAKVASEAQDQQFAQQQQMQKAQSARPQ